MLLIVGAQLEHY